VEVFGFDWEKKEQVAQRRVEEELAELKVEVEAISPKEKVETDWEMCWFLNH